MVVATGHGVGLRAEFVSSLLRTEFGMQWKVNGPCRARFLALWLIKPRLLDLNTISLKQTLQQMNLFLAVRNVLAVSPIVSTKMGGLPGDCIHEHEDSVGHH